MAKWIQRVIGKPGALHRQLEIPQSQRIPTTLLERIVAAQAGQRIRNPTTVGRGLIPVTRLLEHRAILALNLRNMRRR
jgi:hypothetical protein